MQRALFIGAVVISLGTLASCGGDSSTSPPSSQPTLTVRLPASVASGGVVQASATSSTSASVSWASETPSIASVSTDGRITGVSAGQARIRATAGGTTQTAEITVLPTFVDIALGGRHACARSATNDVYCWGNDHDAELGRTSTDEICRSLAGDVECSKSPRRNLGAPPLIRLSASGGNTCGLTADGAAYCWGANDGGRYGLTAETCGGRPCIRQAIPVAPSIRFQAFGVGDVHYCGIATSGELYCGGDNSLGQLGVDVTGQCGSSTPCSLTPVRVGGTAAYRALSVGGSHTCALDSAGKAFCWGWNWAGQLGNGSSTAGSVGVSTPVSVAGNLTFSFISAGRDHTCALTTVGEAYCWGLNSSGELGDGTNANSSVPRAVASNQRFVYIAEGIGHTCALTSGGRAYCWGLNVAEVTFGGQVGDGTLTSRSTPTEVHRGLTFVQLLTGRAYSCGRTQTNGIYCWGSNLYGQLGVGTTQTHATEPVGVAGLP